MHAIWVDYVRASSADQVENYSLATQEKEGRQFCSKQGLTVTRVFREEGASAKTVNRPEFQKMLGFCRETRGQIKMVVVYNVSRLARSEPDYANTRKHLESLGIGLRSMTEKFDDTSGGKLMEGMLVVWAQFDNDQRSERTVVGMRAALEAGRWAFRPPPG